MSGKRISILVISDSHGRAGALRELCEHSRDAEAVIFLGDGIKDLSYIDLSPVQALCAVRGNCDWSAFDTANEFPEERLLVFGNYHILMMHGHTKGVKGGFEHALLYAYQRGADVLLFGHTHIPQERYFFAGTVIGGVTFERSMYAFNPGSLKEGSFGRIEISGNNILFSHGEY